MVHLKSFSFCKSNRHGLKLRVPLKYIGVILGLYRDNGKENGNYYLGFRVWGL